MASTKAVQTFGKKKTATAVAHAREGKGLIRINGSPINLVQPEILRFKVYEPVLVAGEDTFANIDIRVRVKGGGHTSQIYAIRQAISKAVVAYYAKYVDAFSAIELKKKLVAYDRTLLIADPPADGTEEIRRCWSACAQAKELPVIGALLLYICIIEYCNFLLFFNMPRHHATSMLLFGEVCYICLETILYINVCIR